MVDIEDIMTEQLTNEELRKAISLFALLKQLMEERSEGVRAGVSGGDFKYNVGEAVIFMNNLALLASRVMAAGEKRWIEAMQESPTTTFLAVEDDDDDGDDGEGGMLN